MNDRLKYERISAGCCEAAVTDNELALSFPMTVMYPAEAPEQPVRLGPYPIELAKDAELMEGQFPLVLISHGTGGSPLVYRTLARHLARSGFIVGLPEHPYNNRNDNTLEGTVQNLTYRPRHLQMAADWFFGDPCFGSRIRGRGYSVIGHSLGAYTALAAAGGQPSSFPHESADGQVHRIAVTADPRIQSLVLLAPAAVWFREAGALESVDLPILMLDAEQDPYTPAFHAQIIVEGTASPQKLQYRTVERAGHFSFLSPFPEAMKTPAFLPAQDPPGFDREAFHEELKVEIAEFLCLASMGD